MVDPTISMSSKPIVNRMVDPTPIKLKIKDISLKGMGFIFNGLDYLYVSPMLEIPACVTQFLCYNWTGDPEYFTLTGIGPTVRLNT